MQSASVRAAYCLPELRQELRLFEGALDGGIGSWVIYDPVRHRYFQVSRQAFGLLTCWQSQPVADFVDQARRQLGSLVEENDVDELVKFLLANNLVVDPPGNDARAFSRQAARGDYGAIWGLVHNYLFFKVPLFRPARFLAATLPIVSPLYTRTAAVVVALTGLIGIYFASRQWDLFVSTFIDHLSVEGAALFACSFVLVKSLHEFGHAYTAARAGVRVGSMGVAFMVLTPMLYTDVTDAWRLRDRRARLAIDAAGIVVELALAAVALFLWAFLPDGALRSSAFVIATTSLVMGLAINLNPLMRFDGYHLLADGWGIANLQSRSNALGVWKLREVLFALNHPPPERFSSRQSGLLVLYAGCVWLYRLFLFLGIALLVYHAFFKALGVVLFGVEIVWFIVLPILREVMVWWGMRMEIADKRRSWVTGTVLLLAIAATLAPWSGSIAVQGLVLPSTQSKVFAPRPARIEAVLIADMQHVAIGDVLVRLTAPDLEQEIEQAWRRIAQTEARLARIAGDASDLADRLVLEGELARHKANLLGLEMEQRRLVVRSPEDGTIRELDRDLQAGDWIEETSPILRVVGRGAPQVVAYVDEQDIWRLAKNAHVTFSPEDLLRPKRVGRVVEIAPAGAHALEYIQLASVYGGAVPADRAADGEIKSRSGRHLVLIQLEGAAPDQVERGMLHIEAERESLASRMVRRVLQVLVREGGA